MIFIKPLIKYFDFSGRARRLEFWSYTLFFNVFVFMFLGYLDDMTGMYDSKMGLGLFQGIFSLLTFIPSVAVTVRRLHDTNRSGWWYPVILIPIIGWLWGLVVLCLNGTSGDNRFGKNPNQA